MTTPDVKKLTSPSPRQQQWSMSSMISERLLSMPPPPTPPQAAPSCSTSGIVYTTLRSVCLLILLPGLCSCDFHLWHIFSGVVASDGNKRKKPSTFAAPFKRLCEGTENDVHDDDSARVKPSTETLVHVYIFLFIIINSTVY